MAEGIFLEGKGEQGASMCCGEGSVAVGDAENLEWW